jgi:DNA-binding NtrC family response regulator
VLVVDDEPDMVDSCAFFLTRAGFAVGKALSANEALAKLERDRYSVVITDLRMPKVSGLRLLEEVKERDPDVEVVVITGFPEVDTAVEAMRKGALDYIRKPFTEAEFLERVEKALAHRRVRDGNAQLKERLRKGRSGRRLVARDPAFLATIEMLERAARSDASVLLLGESGTGKEVLAHHLHDSSARAARPFVPVDCAAIPESLFESELFGHAKGAFTGADRARPGLFQVADGGTLFLDEIGELPASFQPKLLRALQERSVRRVGAPRPDEVDVRVVCATNRDLAARVEAKGFRSDLLYRLDVVRIEVPPLRARRRDIEPLAEHFLAEFCARNRAPARSLSAPALAVLESFAWPGNVRQLRNAVERACALGTGARIEPGDLPPEVRGLADPGETRGDGLSDTFQEMKSRKVAVIESEYVIRLLREHGGNVTHCAERAGMSRSAFQKLMQRHGIRSSDYR